MNPDAARTTDVAALAFEYGENVVLEGIRRWHSRVAQRGFLATRMVGSRVPQIVHDTVSASVYGAVAGGLRAGGVVSRELAARGFGKPLDTTSGGRRIRSVLNGVAGSQLRLVSDPQAIVMAVRQDGKDVPASRWWLSEAFDEPSDHLVVFVHGLCESEDVWAGPTGLLEVVAADQTATAVPIRYNSGLSILENGVHLSLLLEQVAAAWPVAVRRLTLVGNSMGGLVVRTALNRGRAEDTVWHRRVTDVLHLGVPQNGNIGEKAQQAVISQLPGLVSPTRLTGDETSVPLRHAVVSASEWTDHEVTERWGTDRLALAPLPWATHHYLTAQWSLDLKTGMGLELHHEKVAGLLARTVASRHPSARVIEQ